MINEVKRKYVIEELVPLADCFDCSFLNKWKLTTEQVQGFPIYLNDRIVGRLLDADEERIYGYVTDGRILYQQNTALSFVV